MKIRFLFLTLFFFTSFVTMAYFSLNVNDPRNGGFWSQGTINTAKITLTNQGTFTQVELEMELGVQTAGTKTGYDSLEIVCDFDLPYGAFIKSAALYIEHQWINAELMTRKEAHAIYEGLVKRRIDPLIIYKNSEIQYKFKIFPIAAAGTRTMRMTYVAPTENIKGNKSSAIPMELFNVSATPVNISLYIKENDDFKDLQIESATGTIALSPSKEKEGYLEAQFSSDNKVKNIVSSNQIKPIQFEAAKHQGAYSYKLSFTPKDLFERLYLITMLLKIFCKLHKI
ncbi:MAG: VIT domain-containing protein [Bacteroidales bacterium]